MTGIAPAPKRKTTSLTLSIGLLNIPVGLYTSTESSSVSRKQFTAEGNPVGSKSFDKVTGEDVERSQISYRYEVEADKFVELTDAEMQAVLSNQKGLAQISGFRPLSQIVDGRFVYDTMMQCRPDTKTAPGSEKAFALLMQAMQDKGVFAHLEIVLRGKTRIAALLPNGRVYLLHFDDEVRQDLPMPTAEFSDAEMAMASQLIDVHMVEKDDVLINEDAKKIHEYAVAKAAGTAEIPVVAETKAAGGDLMALLEASLTK